MTNIDSEPANAGEDDDQRPGTRIVIGGFICAVGFCILLMAAVLFMRMWEDRGAQWWAAVPITLVAIAIWAFYANHNQPPNLIPAPRHPDPEFGEKVDVFVGRLAGRRRALGSTGAVLLFVVGIVWFAAIATENLSQAKSDQFVLNLPSFDAPTPPTTPQPNPPAPQATQATQATQQAPEPSLGATLIWSVERPSPPVPAGAFPIFLGGLLIVGFGIWFPKIDFSQGSQTSLGVSEKLIAPVLSLALVALGTSQQADAARTAAGVKLTEQGLPPTIQTSSYREVYLANPSNMSQASMEHLSASVDSLAKKLNGGGSNVTTLTPGGQTISLDPDSIAKLAAALSATKLSIKTPITVDVPRSNGALSALASRVGSIQTTMDGIKPEAENALAKANTAIVELNQNTASVCAESDKELGLLKQSDTSDSNQEAAAAVEARKFHFEAWVAELGKLVSAPKPMSDDGSPSEHDKVRVRMAQLGDLEAFLHCHDDTHGATHG